MGDADYIHAFQKVVLPIGLEFAPDLVMSKSIQSKVSEHSGYEVTSTVSAGFDAAAGDELGECLVSPAGYAHMTHMLAGLANGRMVVALEVSIILKCIQLWILTSSGHRGGTIWIQSRSRL